MNRLASQLLLIGLIGCSDPGTLLEQKGAVLSRSARGNIAGVNLAATHIKGAELAKLRAIDGLVNLTLGDSTSDADVIHLRGWRELRVLDLRDTRVTDAGLRHLDGLALQKLSLPQRAKTNVGLKYYLAATADSDRLELQGWDISDSALQHLKQLPQLKGLSLHDTSVGDAGLKHLAPLTSLLHLGLGGTRTTDRGLLHLKRLKQLERLFLSRTQVTDRGLAHLESLSQLQRLTLEGTQVRDPGLMHVAKLTALERLSLENTQITDEGLVHLRPLSHLQVLVLSENKISDDGVANLGGLTGLRSLGLDGVQISVEHIVKHHSG